MKVPREAFVPPPDGAQEGEVHSSGFPVAAFSSCPSAIRRAPPGQSCISSTAAVARVSKLRRTLGSHYWRLE